jgi:hypothetical protein
MMVASRCMSVLLKESCQRCEAVRTFTKRAQTGLYHIPQFRIFHRVSDHKTAGVVEYRD